MNPTSDPRTVQFAEVLFVSGVIVTVHLAAFASGRLSNALVSRNYMAVTCLIIPVIAVILAATLKWRRSWHWGQVSWVVLVALLLSFLQFLIIGEASVAV